MLGSRSATRSPRKQRSKEPPCARCRLCVLADGCPAETPRRRANHPVAHVCTTGFVIGETGFEPATARPPAGCATRLRHSPWSTAQERATGIEPALEAWKASVQPQHFARQLADNPTARGSCDGATSAGGCPATPA